MPRERNRNKFVCLRKIVSAISEVPSWITQDRNKPAVTPRSRPQLSFEHERRSMVLPDESAASGTLGRPVEMDAKDGAWRSSAGSSPVTRIRRKLPRACGSPIGRCDDDLDTATFELGTLVSTDTVVSNEGVNQVQPAQRGKGRRADLGGVCHEIHLAC